MSFFFSFEAGYHVSQVGIKLTMQLKDDLELLIVLPPPPPSAEITDGYHHSGLCDAGD